MSAQSDRGTALVAWYRRHARDLPWRATRDPWAILVSEVMLQQTQVDRVVPRYRAFLDRFPTPSDAAAAPLADVLAVWSGLGYNARAKRLRDAARIVARDGWPRDAAGLRRLPGVGPYTAAAVAAIAFGEDVAAVDTNVRRVLSRWHGAPLTGAALADVAQQAVTGDAATWNQAVMDLGADVCRPRDPRCDTCPVATWCADPTVYVPPPRQGTFAGSSREVRGAVVRSLVGRGWTDPTALKAASGHEPDRVAAAIAALVAEGMLERHAGRIRLSRIS